MTQPLKPLLTVNLKDKSFHNSIKWSENILSWLVKTFKFPQKSSSPTGNNLNKKCVWLLGATLFFIFFIYFFFNLKAQNLVYFLEGCNNEIPLKLNNIALCLFLTVPFLLWQLWYLFCSCSCLKQQSQKITKQNLLNNLPACA